MSRRAQWIRLFAPSLRLLRWGYESPWMLGFYVAGVSLGYALLAWPLGLNAVTFNGVIPGLAHVKATVGGVNAPSVAKEVGYWSAPNWAFYSVIIMPFMVVTGVRLWFIIPDTLRQMAKTGVARDETGCRLSEAALRERWVNVRGQGILLFLIIFVASMVMVASDWWMVVGDPLSRLAALKGVALNDPSLEFDWSIACRYETVHTACGAVGLFGGIAYLFIAGLVTSAVFATCLCGLLFVGFVVGGAVDKRRRFHLYAVPDGPTDRRGGFGVFADFFSTLFGLTLTVVIGCLAMILQNSYLRDPSSPNIANFVFGDVSEVINHFVKADGFEDYLDAKWWSSWLFAPQTVAGGNFQTFAGVVLFAMTALVSVGGALILLRFAARRALKRSQGISLQLADELGMTHDELKTCLGGVDFWPVGWMKQNYLLLIVGLLALSLFSYRLLIAPLALGTLQLVFWMVKKEFGVVGKIWKKLTNSDQPEAVVWQDEDDYLERKSAEAPPSSKSPPKS